jgi:soluble cytochrome b562
MNAEYNHLYSLKNSKGYEILMALWAIQHQKIVDAMRKSGKQNKEMNWRYFAGQQEGFELAITQVDRAMKEMEEKGEDSIQNAEAAAQVEALLRKVKGEAE